MLSITTLQNITNYAVNEAVVTDDARDVFPGLSLVETFSMINEQVLAEAVLVEQYVTEAEAMQITCATTNPENLEALQEAVGKGILGTIRGLIDRAIKFISGLWKKFTDYLTKLKDRFTKSANYKAVVADPKMKNKEFTWHDWNIEALTTKARKANSSVASRMKTYVQVMMKLIKIIGNVAQSAGEPSYMAALSDQVVAATEGWITGLGKAYGVGEDVEDATDLRERVYKSCFNGDDTKDRQETLENILKAVPNPAKTIEDLKKMMGEASTNVGKLRNDLEDLKVALDKYAEEQSPEDQTAPAKNELMGKIARDISKMISVLTTGLNSSACVIISQAQLCTYDLGRVNDFCANVDIHAKESGKVIDVEDSELKPVQEAAEMIDENAEYNLLDEAFFKKDGVWPIRPGKSVGPIKFGMSREEIATIFSDKEGEFKKTKASKSNTDNYGTFHVYYETEKANAVECFGQKVSYRGKELIGMSAEDVNKLLDLEHESDKDQGGVDAKKQIGITVVDDKVKSVLVGAKGYYNDSEDK